MIVKGKRGLSIIVACAMALTLALASGAIRPGPAEAESVGGWYEQDSGTSSYLRDIFAVDSNTAWAVGESGTILKTTDGGATWNPQESGTTNHLSAISAADKNVAWAVGESGMILKTTDGGATWNPQVSGTSLGLGEVFAVDSKTVWVVGAEATILKTTDGGETWNPQTTGTTYSLRGIAAADAQTAWVAGYEVFKTTDGGANWTKQEKPPSASWNDISVIDENTAWGASERGEIFKTTNGGANWIKQDSVVYGNTMKGIFAADAQTAWVVGYGYSNGIIAKTADGGDTWIEQVPAYKKTLYSVSAADEYNAWAVGETGTILRTEGGGRTTSYFAEGCTAEGFQEYLCIGNPDDTGAATEVTYMFTDGTNRKEQIVIPAQSRATINVNASAGEGREVSAVVSSDSRIVCERPMYFSYQGAWSGGHDAMGAASPATTFYFAEGYTGPGFEEWICVLNPGEAAADLTFRFQTEEEGPIERSGYSVPAGSRSTFKVNDILGPNYQTSLQLESSQPVVAERPMYFSYSGTGGWGWQGGHCVPGATELSREYFFAEGTTRPGFEEWLCLQNLNPEPITITASYQLGAGQGEATEISYEVEAKSRKTVYVPAEIGAERDVSVYLTSEADFLAERPMYFSYSYAGLSARGGDCVIGANAPARRLRFAEGYTGPGFDTWLCIQNPYDYAATIRVYFYTQEEGLKQTEPLDIPPRSRYTLMVNDYVGSGYQLSCEIVAGGYVTAERAMYFDYGGWDGGHDVVGYAP